VSVPLIDPAFSWGEISPSLWGRVDLAKWHSAAATLRNCYVNFRGGAYSRAGTAFVGMSRQTPLEGDPPPRLVNFNFSLLQNYCLEFGNFYGRIITNGAYVTEAPVTITAISQSNPAQITAANDFAAGDWVALAGIGGMTLLNGNTYIVGPSPTATHFTITDLDGISVDSTAFTAYTGGGTAARIYTFATPFAASAGLHMTDLQYLKWAQSADVMTFCCVNQITGTEYVPQNLSRSGTTNWSFAPLAIGTTAPTPFGLYGNATVGPNSSLSPPTLPCAYAYNVTSIDPTTGEESNTGVPLNITDGVDIAETAGSNVINWASLGSVQFKIYRAPPSYNTGNSSNALPVPIGSLFGLIGESLGTQFVDSNITADFSISPPQHRNPFAHGQILSLIITSSSNDWTVANAVINTSTGSGAVIQPIINTSNQIVAGFISNPGGNYSPGDTISFFGDGTSATGILKIGPQTGTNPSVVNYFQQRRIFADSLNEPDTMWGSQPGAFNNFDVSIPVGDADALTITPWSEQVNGVQWMLEMPGGLVTFTGSSIQTVQASGASALNPQPLTPTSAQALPQSSYGSSSTLRPERINWNMLAWEPDNSTLRKYSYQIWFNLYTGNDTIWQSSHLTQNHQIVDTAWCRKPNYLYWAVRDDGVLLSMTFLEEQEVAAWAKHTTQGAVRALCSTTELPIDALYLCVERPVARGGTRYFIERMDNRLWESSEDPWCVDCGVATVLPEPNATLFASTSGGSVIFTATAAVFNPGDIGSTLRFGGGIAAITGYVSSQALSGVWVYPCQQIIPDDPNGTPMWQMAGNWTLAPQLTSVGPLPFDFEGKQVVGLADGIPIGPLTINQNLVVHLPFPASNVKLGLGFTAQVQSVYLDAGQPTIQGRRKAVNAVTVRVETSGPMQAGANQVDASAQAPPPTFATWTNLASIPKSQLAPTYPSPGTFMNPTPMMVQPLFTGDMRVVIPSAWQKPGQVAAQQTLPQPLQVLAFVPELLEGDLPEATIQPRQRQDQPPQARRA